MQREPLPDLSPWAGEPESMDVTVDTGDHLHYLDWRAAARDEASPLPPLLLLHGLMQTAWTWAPVARRLCPLAPTLAPDLRGHGLSDAPRGGYDLESQAFDMLTVLTANGWGSDASGPAVVVAGHGLGAMVAVAMAVLRPGSITALALVDAGWEQMAEATGVDAAEFQRGLGDPPEVLASMEAYLADRREFDPPSWDADQERAARAAVDEKHAGHVAPATRPHAIRGAIDAMFEYDPDALSRVGVPLLIAVSESGSPDDETVRERRLALDDVLRQRAAAGLPPSTVERYAGAGHNLMRYRPAELSAAMARLLRDSSTSGRTPGGPA